MKLKKKPLRCPKCGQRIIDAVEKEGLIKLVAEEEMLETDYPDYFQKCPKCKKQIAIMKVS